MSPKSQNYLFILVSMTMLFFLVLRLNDEWRIDLRGYDQVANYDLMNIFESEYQFKHTRNRRFFNSKEELEQTKVVKINPGQCKDDSSLAIFIHSVAQATGHYYDRRQNLRNSWVSDSKRKNMSVFFVIGLNNYQNNSRVQSLLEMESKQHKDIIQFGFVDHYYNLTLKAISLLEWINNYCNKSKTILKTDDDVVVNIDKLIKMADDFDEDFLGYLLNTEKPFRDERSIWYMPQHIYPDDKYPSYMRGSAYLMKTKIVSRLLNAARNYSGLIYDIDDMFVTGIIASKVGSSRRHSHEFHLNTSCDIPVCDMYSYAVLGECNVIKAYSQFWEEWKTSSPILCQSSTFFTTLSLLSFIIVLNFVLILFILIILKQLRKLSRKIRYSNYYQSPNYKSYIY